MSEPTFLRPFWRYYGAKWRAAPHYPAPKHAMIIEPFAGAAGYSLRHYRHRVVLIEKYEVLVEIWRYLIRTPSSEILAIPTVDHIDDLPAWVPQAARWLVGFSLNHATTAPRKSLSAGMRRNREHGRKYAGWSPAMRDLIASQVNHIRHWLVIQGEYHCTNTSIPVTWFVDPPYQAAGRYYKFSSAMLDFAALGDWCRSRRGQTIVCENDGATWLPFEHFRNIKASDMTSSSMRSTEGKSAEAIWYQECA